MKKLAFLLLVVLCASFVMAQDASKFEVFGGYQLVNFDSKADLTDLNRLNMHGWNTDFAAKVAKNFSVVADVSGNYKTQSVDIEGTTVDAKLHLTNFLFGPRVSVSTGKITPFAEALFGVTRSSIGGSAAGVDVTVDKRNNLGVAIGGGLDVNASQHIAIRVAKFDYLLTHVSDSGVSENLNNLRFASGIVFKF